MTEFPRVAGCTIVARNYIAQARVLCESFRRHHPGSPFYALIVDGMPSGERIEHAIEIFGSELPLPAFRELCFKYEITELCTAVKPSFLSHLLRDRMEERVVYLDPDILVMRPLEEIWPGDDGSSIVLTPHVLTPIPDDGLEPRELELLSTGVYNLGFLGVRSDPETFRFLDWWEARLREGCLRRPDLGMFVDQKWVDRAPAIVEKSRILRDETYNVAYWNLYERPVSRRGVGYFVGDRPIALFHFSNVDLDGRRFRRSHWNRVDLDRETAVAELIRAYSELCESAGREEARQQPYGFSVFDDGAAVSLPMRELYRQLSGAERARFGDPFRIGPGSFREWALTPGRRGELSPFLRSLYELRKDVRAAYPNIEGRDRPVFLEWARTSGALEMGFDPTDVREPAPADSRSPSRIATAAFRVARVEVADPLPDEIEGFSIDIPCVGACFDPRAVEIEGWILGGGRDVTEITVETEGRIPARARVGETRPDVAAAYPDIAKAAESGFRALIDVGNQSERTLEIRARFGAGAPIQLGSVAGRFQWETGPAAEPPLVSIVVAAQAESDGLLPTLQSATVQAYPFVEICVVGRKPSSEAERRLDHIPGILLMEADRTGTAAAVKTGLRGTTGEFVVLMVEADVLDPTAITDGLLCLAAQPASAACFGHPSGRAAVYRRAAFEYGSGLRDVPSSGTAGEIADLIARRYSVCGRPPKAR